MDTKEWLKGKEDYKLCYIQNNFAYFTNLDLEDQWGDDWNDFPYEHNAGLPSFETEDQIIKIAYDGYNLETPADKAGLNSQFSVEMINAGSIAWLSGYDYKGSKYVSILAGVSIEEFIFKVLLVDDGEIFLPL